MPVSKLTWSSLLSRKARLVLTVLAIALSVSLVIAVTSGYASAEAALIRYFTEFMGSTDIKVHREAGQQGNIKESIVDARNDRAIGLLRGLGFTVEPAALHEATGRLCHRVWIEADSTFLAPRPPHWRQAPAGCGDSTAQDGIAQERRVVQRR